MYCSVWPPKTALISYTHIRSAHLAQSRILVSQGGMEGHSDATKTPQLCWLTMETVWDEPTGDWTPNTFVSVHSQWARLADLRPSVGRRT